MSVSRGNVAALPGAQRQEDVVCSTVSGKTRLASPWVGHRVDWGAPKRNVKFGDDAVIDPSAKRDDLDGRVPKMRRDACYEIVSTEQ